MINLPVTLRGRWQILASEVAEVFEALAGVVNGGLNARNFARRAGIRSDQREHARSVAVVQTRLSLSATTRKAVCQVPPGAGWEHVGLYVHAYWNGAFDVVPPPLTGTIHHGGADGHAFSEPIAIDPDGFLLRVNEDRSDPATGNVHVEVEHTSGDGWGICLTSWFLTPNLR